MEVYDLEEMLRGTKLMDAVTRGGHSSTMSEYHYYANKVSNGLYSVLDTIDLVSENVKFEDFVEIFTDKFINSLLHFDNHGISMIAKANGGKMETLEEMAFSVGIYNQSFEFAIKDGYVRYRMFDEENFGDALLEINVFGKKYTWQFIPYSVEYHKGCILRYNNTAIDYYGSLDSTSAFYLEQLYAIGNVLYMRYDLGATKLLITIDYNTSKLDFKRSVKLVMNPVDCIDNYLDKIKETFIMYEQTGGKSALSKFYLYYTQDLIANCPIIKGVNMDLFKEVMSLYIKFIKPCDDADVLCNICDFWLRSNKVSDDFKKLARRYKFIVS